MKKLIVILLFGMGLTSLGWAGANLHHNHAHEHDTEARESAGVASTRCEDQVKVRVNGLVCDFCARALEKVFGRRDEVAAISVDLDGGLVIVATHPGQTISDADVKRMVTDSGYSVVSLDEGC